MQTESSTLARCLAGMRPLLKACACREQEEQEAAAEARHMAVQSLDTNIDEPTRVLLPSGQVSC